MKIFTRKIHSQTSTAMVIHNPFDFICPREAALAKKRKVDIALGMIMLVLLQAKFKVVFGGVLDISGLLYWFKSIWDDGRGFNRVCPSTEGVQ